MRDLVLMPEYEPTDEELKILMQDVSNEAKKKALQVKKQLKKSVADEIQKIRSKYQTKIIKM